MTGSKNSPPTSFRPNSPRRSHVSHISSSSLASPHLSPIRPPPPARIIMPTNNLPDKAVTDDPFFGDEKAHEKSPTSLNGGNDLSPSQARLSRARSLVGNIVSGIRNSMPRAATRGQIHSRRSSSRYSVAIHGASGMPLPTYMQPPPEFPILLPPGIPLMPYMDPNTTGSCCSMYKDDTCQSSGTLSSRIGGFLVELSSMPWISERVVDEYIPGQRSGSHNKNSSSWYSVRAPASPSDISSKWRMVPDPWFAPRNLPVTQEEPEPVVGGAGDEQEQEHVGQEVRELREEVQTKTREVDTLQQTVEHQKKHIAALEDELEQLKGLQVESPDLRGRRSSTRLYRKRDSVRTVTSVIRSVSRPPSIL